MKFVTEAFSPSKPEAESAPGGIPIFDGECDISNAAAFVFANQMDSAPCVVAHDRDDGEASSSVHYGISCNFAGSGDDLGLIDEVKSDFNGGAPHCLSHQDHVVL